MKLFTNSIRSFINNETKLLKDLLWRNQIIQLQPQQTRSYAAKKKVLTDAQIQVQKHAAEMGFKEKTTIRGTLFEFYDVETSIKYIKSEGNRGKLRKNIFILFCFNAKEVVKLK
jgi:hypothetical protein